MKKIPLTLGKIAIVDDADYEWLSQWKWLAVKGRYTFYAVRRFRSPNGKLKTEQMHRKILGLMFGDKRQGDHKNHNGLDNRRNNLRICTHAQNQQNRNPNKACTSIYKGVNWDERNKRWRARIRIKGRLTHLGLFYSETEAAKTYDLFAKDIHGEFANTNIKESE